MQLLKNKNQNKGNKVRFQHGQFTKKLDQQRNFKRKVRFVPTNVFDRALAFIGLNNRWKQLLALVLLLALGYVMYAPNLLTVKTVRVGGASDELNLEMQEAVGAWLEDSPFYYPKNNILLFSSKKLKQHLLNDSRIYRVSNISKKLTDKSLAIELVPRSERFLVYTPERIYDFYNDGFFKAEAGLSVGQWRSELASHLIKLKLPGNIDSSQQFLFSEEWIGKFELIQTKIAQLNLPRLEYIAFGPDRFESDAEGNSRVVKLSALPFQPDELSITLNRLNGGAFDVILDPRSNLEEALMRLSLLYNQTQSDRLMKLKYIDMRLEERGFICLEDAVCAQNPEPVN